MKGICPSCERVRALDRVSTTEDIEVRGEAVPVKVEFLRCSECGEEFRDPKSSYDPLDVAYREYRRRHGMVQPETLKQLRAEYDLTQQELADLLGWGVATVSRYENGALQDEAHDKMLRLAVEPRNLLMLIQEKPAALSDVKRDRVTNQLKTATTQQNRSMMALYEERFGGYEPNSLSGYQRLNLVKLFNAILFFCSGAEVLKTKLNKLLFYADFKHFQEYTLSITGARYVHLPYGPVPDNYELYFAALYHDEKSIEIEERGCHGYVGEVFTAVRQPDLNVFSASELKVLASVKEYFQDFNATDISDLSHEEKAYRETKSNDFIDYEFAGSLSV